MARIYITRDIRILAMISILLIVSSIGGYEYASRQNTDSFGIKGTFALYENNHLVLQTDQITYTGYATAICKIFNDSTACAQASNAWGITGSGASVGLGQCGSGASFVFYSKSHCAMTGVVLTDSMTNPVIGGNCPAIITSNGMSPIVATTSFSQNTQSVILTASWTASGTQSFDGACLVASSYIGAGYYTGGINAFAMQLFATQNVVSGQAWSAQWTFSF